MTIIEQIKDFVKSQLEDNKRLSKENSIFAVCGSEDETILRFLDSLESENPSEGLEEEIRGERKKLIEAFGPMNGEQVITIKDFARHFAQWGAEHSGSSEIPKDLEEAADDYTKGYYDDCSAAKRAAYHGFIAGYKFHADHTPLPEDTVIYQKGVEEGKRLMMQEAVEGEVSRCATVHYVKINESELFARLKQFQKGDKVSVIICKKED